MVLVLHARFLRIVRFSLEPCDYFSFLNFPYPPTFSPVQYFCP